MGIGKFGTFFAVLKIVCLFFSTCMLPVTCYRLFCANLICHSPEKLASKGFTEVLCCSS